MINSHSRQVERVSFASRYVNPVLAHPVCRAAYQVVAEVVKIAAAKVFLELLTTRLISNQTKMAPKMVWTITVFAPVVEEILFRGILQRGIGFCQMGYNRFILRGETTEENLKAQRVFRVQLTGLLFAAAHLSNPHEHLSAKLLQFSWCYLGGVAYGYLSDKYNTLFVSILGHGVNNLVAVYMRTHPNAHPLICIPILAINPLAAYVLGTTDLGEHLSVRAQEVAHACATMPGRLMTWLRPGEAQEDQNGI